MPILFIDAKALYSSCSSYTIGDSRLRLDHDGRRFDGQLTAREVASFGFGLSVAFQDKYYSSLASAIRHIHLPSCFSHVASKV